MTDQERIATLESQLAAQAHAAMRAQERVAELEGQVCRMREVLTALLAFPLLEGDLRLLMLSLKATGLDQEDDDYAKRYGAIRDHAEAALSASAPCPHQQEACRMREALPAIQDHSYADGAQAGWNAALSDAPNAKSLEQLVVRKVPVSDYKDALAAFTLSAFAPCPHQQEACRLKEALRPLAEWAKEQLDLHPDRHDDDCVFMAVNETKVIYRDMITAVHAVFSSGSCSHSAEVERLRARLDWVYAQFSQDRPILDIGRDLCRVIEGGMVDDTRYATADEAVDAARLRAAEKGGGE